MLFNKNDNGSQELHDLTGSYYASNDYSRIKSEVDLAMEDVERITGSAIMRKVEEAYTTTPIPSNDYAKLVPFFQLPVAILASLSMTQKNDISHEHDGRKVKIAGDGEKLPWEWQLKRDDEIQLNAYYKAVDRLLRKLDELDPDEWKNSDQKKTASSLLIRNADEFNDCYPIERSGRMYMLLLPFIKEAQRRIIKPALGIDFPVLIARSEMSDARKELLEFARPPLALFAMALAMRRLPLGVIPFGVIRNYVSSSQTMSASEPASVSDIKALASWMEDDAKTLLDEMKRARSADQTPVSLLPENSVDNKFFRA